MSSHSPRVTVVIPCHNHAHWVNDAIDSVVAQDYPDKRVVVVDDGSTDGSDEAVKSSLQGLAEPHAGQGIPEIYWGTRGPSKVPVLLAKFYQPRGPAFARNQGVRASWADADLYAFLDSDDVYLRGKISRSVAKWQEAPDHIGAVYTDYETLDPKTGVAVREYREPFSRRRLLEECLPNMDSLLSKEAFQKCGLFDESLRVCEDYDLWLRISEHFLLTHVPECLLRLRVGPHGSTANVRNEVWKACYAKVFQKARERAEGAAP